jgi:selenophosphate synthetase-related protein
MANLARLVETVRSAPGLLGKRDVKLVERLSAGIDGDDAALVEHRGEYLVVCGEAISPPFVAEDPFGAGSAAVVTNVSDVRAMGARPLALVDMLVSPDREHAERVLDGIAWAAELLGVPVVGGPRRSATPHRSRLPAPARLAGRCGPQPPSPATPCSPPSRSTAGT